MKKELSEDVEYALSWATKFRVIVLFSKSKVKFYLDKGEDNYESLQLVPPVIIEYFFGRNYNGLAESEFERIFKEIGFTNIARIYL